MAAPRHSRDSGGSFKLNNPDDGTPIKEMLSLGTIRLRVGTLLVGAARGDAEALLARGHFAPTDCFPTTRAMECAMCICTSRSCSVGSHDIEER
jgi:hypothetical protein